MSAIYDSTMTTLERSLDVAMERHAVLASNLANLDTPRFTPRDIDAGAAMSREGPGGFAMATTSPGHLSGAAGGDRLGTQAVERPDIAPGLDGNSVDLDRQLAKLAENGLQYAASLRLVRKKFALLQYAVSQAGGV